ncbi:MAG: hypothetical protein AB1650_09270 [Candidatus Omnitrophota bacterium]
MQIREYYEDSYVQARMIEFMGGKRAEESTCVYLLKCDVVEGDCIRKLPTELEFFLLNEMDVCRSLWDRKYLLVHLDIEYVNFDFPGEPYLDYERCFQLQQPLMDVVMSMFVKYGLKPLHLLSGRGHHFTWCVKQKSPIFHQLAGIGRLSENLRKKYREPHPPTGESIGVQLGKAFSGLGLAIEYLSFEAKAKSVTRIPVQITAVRVEPQERGREVISIDISEYADPLDTRMIRIPFSVYHKHFTKRWLIPDNLRDTLPPIFLIPLTDHDYRKAIRIMRNPDEVHSLARTTSATIPECPKAMKRLIDDYKASRLARFHEWFYSQEHEDPENWLTSYDQAPLDRIPACARNILENPNDLLLRPECIRHVVICFLALGWHPRQIAGLIRSKYERNYGWGRLWYIYDAAERADFYTRVFSGLIELGYDLLDDFTCEGVKKSGVCFHEDDKHDLASLRKSVLKRRWL